MVTLYNMQYISCVIFLKSKEKNLFEFRNKLCQGVWVWCNEPTLICVQINLSMIRM
jgi:hypothetical protein